MADNPRNGAEESRRILERIQREQEPAGGGLLRRARDHVAAADADASDPIELWGTRIGRAIGLVITIAIFGFLLIYILGG